MRPEDDMTIYTVVINERGHCSIWPHAEDVPEGWREVGKTGRRRDCVAYIQGIGTDTDAASGWGYLDS